MADIDFRDRGSGNLHGLPFMPLEMPPERTALGERSWWQDINDAVYRSTIVNGSLNGIVPGTSAAIAAANSTALQKLAAVLTLVGGGVIFLPASPTYYDFSTPVNFDDKFCITIAGAGGRCVPAHQNGTMLRYTGSGAASFLSFRSTTGCGVKDCQVLFSSATFTGSLLDWSHSALAQDTNQFVLDSCTLSSDTGTPHTNGNCVKADKAIVCTIKNCYMGWCDSCITGQDPAGGSYSVQIVIKDNCIFVGTNSVPILYPHRAWVIRDCTFEQRAGGNVGGVLCTALTPCWGMTIDGCIANDASAGGSTWFTLYGGGITARGNSFIGVNAGPNSTAFSLNGVVGFHSSGNTFDDFVIAYAFNTATCSAFVEEGNYYNNVTNIFGSVANCSSFAVGTTKHTILPNGFLLHSGTINVAPGTPVAVLFTPNFSAVPDVSIAVLGPAVALNTGFVNPIPTTAGMTVGINGGVGATAVSWTAFGPGRA